MGLIWAALLIAPLAVGAHLVSRHGFRQPTGLPRLLAAVVLGWTWLTVGMEALGTAGLLTREWLLGWSLAGLGVGLICRWLRRAAVETPAGTVEPWGWEETVALGLVVWASALLGVTSLLHPVKVVSDGPIYHLYFAARWWKGHRLSLIAAPFGENAATYFPAVGDLWFTWLMTAWGGDRLAKVGQVPFFAVSGLAAFGLARRFVKGRASAVIATAWFLTATPFLIFSFEPNVDTILVAGYLLAAYFFGRHALGDGGIASLALGALAAGAALGTKVTGVVFVPVLLVAASLAVARRGGTRREKALGWLAIWLLPLVASGFWYARNFVLTGNPLYPLHATIFGRPVLAGWYGPDVMTMSRYYLPMGAWRAFGDIALALLDPRTAPLWIAGVLGAWAWGRSGEKRDDALVWVFAALAVVNIALYWFLIPYRTQQRFMFQAIGLAAVPLAVLFDRARWLRIVGLVLLAVHLTTPHGWPFAEGEPPWDLTGLIPNAIRPVIALPIGVNSGGVGPTAVTATVGLCAFATAWFWGRCVGRDEGRGRRVTTALAMSLGFAAGMGSIYYPWGGEPRREFYPGFEPYIRGWLELDLRSGRDGVRVAYAGTDIPYYLLGVGLRNDVRYINIDGHRDWLLHDYQREAIRSGVGPTTWNFPRPGWDRQHPDYDQWLANLRAEDIQVLVVTRAKPEEGPHLVADAQGFPIEQVWALAHPETFESLYGNVQGDREFRFYRLRPAPERPN